MTAAPTIAGPIDPPPGSGVSLETAAPLPRIPLWRRTIRAIFSGIDWIFGLVCLGLGLAIVSIIPVLSFLSLGYLIHASGRVARTGRLRYGFVGVRKASVIGSFLAGTWLVFLPVRFVSGLWKDAELIAPGRASAGLWHFAVIILSVLTVLHVIWACLRGGRVRHFLWPAPIRFIRWLSTPEKFSTIRNSVVDFTVSLRLPYYFWLGARGFFGAFLWLLVPVGFLILAGRMAPDKGGAFFSLIGGFLLMLVVLHLPFLQTHFALQNRFGAIFEIGEVRRLFRRAPVAFWLSLFITLLFSLPLYLLKIELPPREVAWLPSLLFVLFIFPARLLTGWAVSRARRRQRLRHWFFRWTSRLALVPVAFFYVFFVYLTQYLSWNGSLSLLEQHAFMVPAPLMNL